MICRFLTFCFAFLAFTSVSEAQDVVGFRIGLSVANIGGDIRAEDDFGSRVGFAAGLFGTIPLRHSLSVQPELLYAQKGFTTERAAVAIADEPGDGDLVSARLELTYLDVPVLIKYTLSFTSQASLSFYLGPTISFELSERIVIDGLQGSQESDQFGSPEYGFTLGSDITGSLAGTEGLVGVRYNRGLGNVLNREVSGSESRSIYNQSFVLFVGVHLR
ncbi:MAG: porin family protein [Rhodothermales bacterium]